MPLWEREGGREGGREGSIEDLPRLRCREIITVFSSFSEERRFRCVIILARGAGPSKAMTTDFFARSTCEGGREGGKKET